MNGTGAIHVSEIEPTLQRLETDLNLSLVENLLGSAGKREFSGDIDVAVDASVADLLDAVNKSDIIVETQKGPIVVMAKVEIQNYRKTFSPWMPMPDSLVRTGYVQIDFMHGQDIDWLKTFYHSPGDQSKYKGAHRNIVIGALSQFVARFESKEKTDDGRPLETHRYMFSSKDGLVRIIREPKKRKDGNGYTKSHKNTIIDGPWKTADHIAAHLGLVDASNLDSFETVFTTIEKNHGPHIAGKVANALVNDQGFVKLGIPTELEPYT